MGTERLHLVVGFFVAHYWDLSVTTEENSMINKIFLVFLFSILVIPLHYSSAIYQSSLLDSLLARPSKSTSWTPIKPITLNQAHSNPYAPLGSQYNQMYTKSANDFTGWTNTKAPLGSQFNPIYIGNSSTRSYSSWPLYSARLGTQFNPIYLSPVTGY